MKPQITIEEFLKLDLRVGEVTDVTDVADSQKLLKLTVDFGEFTRIIYSGIKKWYSPENLQGKKYIFVVNLAPRTFKIGDQELISEGMILAGGDDEAVLYSFDKDIKNGTTIH